MRDFRFIQFGGERTRKDRPGKVEWPHLLRLQIAEPHVAADLCGQLAQWLAGDRERPFSWNLCGEVRECADEVTGEERPLEG